MYELECKIKIKIDNPQGKALANEIKDFIDNQVGGKSSGGYGEIQEEVLNNLDFNDDVCFSDIGVIIETQWFHDWM